jgi:cytochrome c-type protein NapC
MAENEWARMKAATRANAATATTSMPWSVEKQKKMPYKKHMEAKAAGKSCIDCHKGIAHKLPKGYVDPSMEEEE